MRRQRRYVLAAILLALGDALAPGSTAGQPGYWKGKLEVVAFNFTEVTEMKPLPGQLTGPPIGPPYFAADVTEYRYDVYQNQEGVVRHELTYTSRNRSVGWPLDIELLDYGHGYGLGYNKRGDRAERYRLRPPVSGVAIEQRRILGHQCEQLQYEWEDSLHDAKIKEQVWLAADAVFEDPLLKIRHIFGKGNVLKYMEIRVMTRLEAVGNLPASLFEPPAGLKVIDQPIPQ